MYSKQDLEYASAFREEIHKEALAIVRKMRSDVTEVIDRHPVEDYFQEHWDYPGMWYTIVAIPYGYNSRKAFVDAIVRDTLSGGAPSAAKTEQEQEQEQHDKLVPPDDDAFYALIAEYPDLVVDYCIVKPVERYRGYASHRAALKTAWQTRLSAGEDGEAWQGNPTLATGKQISVDEFLSADYRDGELNYRKAFLYPPHENGYTGKDFVRVNAALFPNGTDGLDVYRWSTDWSEYFDEGREWWGTLCLTVYDKTLDRFVVIMASATD